MVNLMRANSEPLKRSPDECFKSLADLRDHCVTQMENSTEVWSKPQAVTAVVQQNEVALNFEDGEARRLNEWSFGQLCTLCGVSPKTINRLSPKTATIAFEETLPRADRPIQFLNGTDDVRSIHGISYTRLWNSELLDVVAKFDGEFQPPKPAQYHYGTGLYAGEQDMFAFLVDDNGWVDIGQDRFAPGFFVWNSEVGSRSVGIQTFWYQHICGNHIVWDCTDVNEFSRKHTSSVRDAIGEVERMITSLVSVKTQRQEQFAAKIRESKRKQLGRDVEEVTKLLRKQGIPMGMIKDAAKVVRNNHSTFAWVDALTRSSGLIEFAGARASIDQKIGGLLSLAI
jgi:hypothetical protein